MTLFFRLFFRFPIVSLVGTFAALIAAGTVLLLSPWASFGPISFLDALFTATSAATATGLVVKSTGSDFTFFGQLIILLLIQAGLIGIMTGAAFFFLLFRKGLGIGYQATLRRGMEQEYIGEVASTVKFIVLAALVFESLGAAALYFIWHISPPSLVWGPGGVAFSAIFHSVSAFGNAGFSLFDNSLQYWRSNLAVNLVFMILIVCGGIGFIVLRELGIIFLRVFWQKRKAQRPPPLSLHTKLVLLMTLGLISAGAAVFILVEGGNPSFSSSQELILAAFFQSISARTAGFNTVPIHELSQPTLTFLMFLMFVGGAPGSTAGGIKVTTLALAFIGALTLYRGRKEVVLFRKRISDDIVRRALANASLLSLFVALSIIVLIYIEKGSLLPLAFEAVSAFGTVGYSMGVTSELSDGGKLLIALLMFIGRLAPLTLAIIGGRKLAQAHVRYPEGRVNLG